MFICSQSLTQFTILDSIVKVAEIQAVVLCIMQEKDRLQVLHKAQLKKAQEDVDTKLLQVTVETRRVCFALTDD